MARAHDANHRAMREAIGEMDGSSGYDAVIVCTSNAAQEAYWQTRLEATRGQAAKNGATIVCVHEDWAADGAGNGLGTLYAYVKARAKAQALGVGFGCDSREWWKHRDVSHRGKRHAIGAFAGIGE